MFKDFFGKPKATIDFECIMLIGIIKIFNKKHKRFWALSTVNCKDEIVI